MALVSTFDERLTLCLQLVNVQSMLQQFAITAIMPAQGCIKTSKRAIANE